MFDTILPQSGDERNPNPCETAATATPAPVAELIAAVDDFLAAHDAVIKAGSGGLFYHRDFKTYDRILESQQTALTALRAAFATVNGKDKAPGSSEGATNGN